MNLVLIGYRGTGKSTVGKILAERLGRELVSTDAEIIRRARLSVPDIVQRFGWDHFRDLESEVCRDLAGKEGLIIDSGGGAILRQQNVDYLKKNGVLIWLTATVRTIADRIGGDTQRPSLTGTKSFTEEVEEVLRERQPKYKAAANHMIETDGRSVTEVVEAILALI
ncbi:MAG: shikimate kinase [Nitrospirae bacterium]|nr:MAG: shikimate kinase [Nitrospirota bacterium]